MLVESKIDYSPTRSRYDGPLKGELINSKSLTVDDHLKAINWSSEQINSINNGTYNWKYNANDVDKEVAIRNHKALIIAHRDQINALGDQGEYVKD